MSFFNFRQKVNLARSLFSKTSPAYVQYYLTSRCNLACEHCNIIYADAGSNEMNIHQIRKTAENFAKIGVSMVLLIGGEPFTRKDLPEIIEVFVKNNIHVRMQTNGLATQQMLQRCVDVGGHDISVSLDSLNESVQDKINGNFNKSWERAIKTVSIINNIFPENGTGFFGTVLMPQNLFHIADVLEFATEIGWGMSLVPVHTTTPDNPLGFRSFDDSKVNHFIPSDYKKIKAVIKDLKKMKKNGMNLYDSEEYIDDIYRYIAGEQIMWRNRNNNVCDTPSLYFALEPNGNIRPCCDYKLDKSFPAYRDDFPKQFQSGQIHKEIYTFSRNCQGCMYGSYPEITISARYLVPFFKRFLFFNYETNNLLKKLTFEEMKSLAIYIYEKNEQKRVNLMNQ